MPQQGAYGRRVAEYAGLKAPPPTVTQTIRRHQFAATRLSSDGSLRGVTTQIPNESSYILSLQLRDFSCRRLWLNGRACPHHYLPEGTINLYDLERDVLADIQSSFDSIQFYLPRAALMQFSESNDFGIVRNFDLELGLGVPDEIVDHLARSLIPALQHPEEVSTLFVDYVAQALYAHLITRYGDGVRNERSPRGGLAPWQERRAKELLDANLGGEISLSHLAGACELSIRQFSRAFRKSSGVSPHQWLLLRRVDRARHLLRDPNLSLAEVAIACGFANQSHFTRIFGRVAGISPGRWRRRLDR